ncbi:type II/IV secretion system protein, partial [Candidatus Peregrinibacteria bacterium]|nr:type II/IV secretion system protein [Candidatus Peregrinibacteria bacterium]
QLEDALISEKLLNKKEIQNLLTSAENKHISLEEILFERGILESEKLGKLIAKLYNVPFMLIGERPIPKTLLRIIPYTLASHQYIIPFEQEGSKLKVALNNPRNFEIINFIEKKTSLSVESYFATKSDIKNALKAYNQDVDVKFKKLLKGALNDPTKIESLKDAVKILDAIILFAYQNNASDIHIEPHSDFITVRYRIDGLLHSITELPIDILELLITRVKVLANLRTDEHQAAQDGRFKIDLESNEITLRVSVLPTYDGEKCVLRILSSRGQDLTLEALGYSNHNLEIIRNNILKTNGIILVTGPTGSGKTTTMYSILKMLNSPEVNISTIEDPIEYRLEGINQIQVNPKAKLTFATGLRSLLRQDPDILMVGEIRDKETAGIAINASLTGHLVFATLHTNDAASTLPRLVDMGIEPFLIASTSKIVIAQRLVRTICDKCKESYEVDFDALMKIGKRANLESEVTKILSNLNPGEKITLYKGKGCVFCGNSGYKGRISISEILEVSENVKKLIFQNGSTTTIEEKAREEGMIPLFSDGMEKVLRGLTTIEEVLRVMRS